MALPVPISTDPTTELVRLLVVDDSEAFRVLLRARTARESDPAMVVVGEARDGREAIDAAGELRPDIIVLDVAMPRMDGLQALPELIAVSPDSRVVMYSANDGYRGQALDAGAHAWVTKGEGWPALRDRIRSLATATGQGAALRT